MITYLYGDSTPSPVTTKYIANLQGILEFCVEVLLQENRASATKHAVANLSDLTDGEVFRAEEIVAHVVRALDHFSNGNDNSIAARCAARIRQGVEELVGLEARAARAVVAMEKARAAQVAVIAGGACAKAFETLLLRQDPPDSTVTTKVWLEGESYYGMRRFGQTPYGLEWTVGVDVPASSAFACPLRMDSIAGRVEIDAPVLTGLFRKEVTVRRQRLDRLYLVELILEPEATTIKLRMSPHISSGGYDVFLSATSSRAEITRVVEGGAAPDTPQEVSDEDATALYSMRDALVALVGEFSQGKQVLVAASFDGTPLHQLDSPHLLVERLVGTVAPTVEQIQRRSLVPGELALKRVLGEAQREEVFVSKAELRKKLEPLPLALRRIFDPLKLWEGSEVTPPPEKPAPEAKVIVDFLQTDSPLGTPIFERQPPKTVGWDSPRS